MFHPQKGIYHQEQNPKMADTSHSSDFICTSQLSPHTTGPWFWSRENRKGSLVGGRGTRSAGLMVTAPPLGQARHIPGSTAPDFPAETSLQQ